MDLLIFNFWSLKNHFAKNFNGYPKRFLQCLINFGTQNGKDFKQKYPFWALVNFSKSKSNFKLQV